MQDSEDRRLILIGRIRMPLSGTLDAVPIHFAVVLDVGKPRHFRTFSVTIFDQGMLPGRAEAAAERGKFRRAESLVAEHEHRMFGKGASDPSDARRSKWL